MLTRNLLTVANLLVLISGETVYVHPVSHRMP